MLTTKALIIAAGRGERLQSNGKKNIPKPLRKVGGLPLIKRIILDAKKAGISEFVVVVGYQKDKIIQAVRKYNLGVKLDFVENPEWQKSNGLSVLAAKSHLRENFVLLMSDHIFDSQTLADFRRIDLGEKKAILAVDYKLKTIFDTEDATKVDVENGFVKRIGKSLGNYNAVDTGMFLLTPGIFDVLGDLRKKGDVSLSDAIQCMASRDEMGTYNIGNAFWQDVDTKPALKHAEKYLLNSCRKSTDGFISRHLNRRISLWISSLLMKTNLSANHVTGLTTFVGILSGVLVARGDYWGVVFGAFFFQMASILDGCDGEISKLKHTRSRVGQWLDTISDNLTYVFFIIGVVLGSAKSGNPYITITGALTIFGLAMTIFVMFIYLIRNTNSGSLLAIQKDFSDSKNESKIKKFFRSIQFMIKRDFFALLFFAMALANGLNVILWTCLIGTNLTWMVLLNFKLGLFKSPTVSEKTTDIVSSGE